MFYFSWTLVQEDPIFWIRHWITATMKQVQFLIRISRCPNTWDDSAVWDTRWELRSRKLEILWQSAYSTRVQFNRTILQLVERKGFSLLRVSLFNPRSTESHWGTYLQGKEWKVSSMTNRIIVEQAAAPWGSQWNYRVTGCHPCLSWKR